MEDINEKKRVFNSKKRKYLFDYVCEKVDFEQWDIEKLNKSESEHRKGA